MHPGGSPAILRRIREGLEREAAGMQAAELSRVFGNAEKEAMPPGKSKILIGLAGFGLLLGLAAWRLWRGGASPRWLPAALALVRKELCRPRTPSRVRCSAFSI